jgi:hypothetical protein
MATMKLRVDRMFRVNPAAVAQVPELVKRMGLKGLPGMLGRRPTHRRTAADVAAAAPDVQADRRGMSISAQADSQSVLTITRIRFAAGATGGQNQNS